MLSQSVQKVIAFAINQDEDQHTIIDLFMSYANESENEQDRGVFKIIGGSLSMSYNVEEKKYFPRITLSDGRRSFAIEDIDDNAVEIVKDLLIKVK